MIQNKVTPILLLTGYLGSGKTTLVNHILTNKKGIKFAVIVNDIGEVNIDAALIQKGGVVDKKDDSLVALQNGCICCTLKMDLIAQINDILSQHRFDYIVIEASGVCEPAPIARTICSIPRMGGEFTEHGICRLDCITTVVDALRMQSEFGCGDYLTRSNIDEEDIENLLIQQIEFCDIILLNKASEVKPDELARIRTIIKALQPTAQIIECDYANVDLERIINTHLFHFDEAATSAAWVKELDRQLTPEELAHQREVDEGEVHHHHHHHHEDEEDEEDEEHEHGEHEHGEHEHEHDEHEHGEHEHGEHEHGEHEHEEHHHHHEDEEDEEHEGEHHHHEGCEHHHHHHHHDGGEVEEYGIGTFVYYRRRPFSLDKFDYFLDKKWNKNIIRAKGVCYFKENTDMSYVFEQAGVQKKLTEAGQWYATMPREELLEMFRQEPDLVRDWDEKYGDRMQKLVFIGQHLDKEQLAADLDDCLA